MGRYEKKKGAGNVDEFLKLFPAEEHDEDDGIAEMADTEKRLRSLHFLKTVLENIKDDSEGAYIEFSSGKMCSAGAGGAITDIKGPSPDVLLGVMSIIASTIEMFDADLRDTLLTDMAGGAKILLQYKKDRGE